jgi:hypothetical protein
MKLWHSGVMIGNEKSLLEYIYTVSHARYQYDIEITTLEQAQPVGKYDVEIEMV